KCGHAQSFMDLSSSKADVTASPEVILNAIVAAQYQGACQAYKFLGFYVQGAFLVCIGVEVENTFDNQVVSLQDFLIHPAAIFIELFYQAHLFCQVFLVKMIATRAKTN